MEFKFRWKKRKTIPIKKEELYLVEFQHSIPSLLVS